MIEEKKEDLYEVEFDTLKQKEVENFEDKTILLNSKLDVSVTIGSSQKSIKEILSLKEGDVIELEKTIDEDLDINVNDEMIANGESIKLGNKISVKLSSLKKNKLKI
ncbi:FliM/FliN family flagellar motor C-terminal domain-containing protein [Clostridium sp. Ade.TY]|uniref:FliM/FliN family flagellar motor switch protein n=1 Tax=Clostridium sp. Ade.TY TaxID=1391647 RepID=UPI00040DD1F7|nr:FliM/FliN family flagellar motor C-terminal domain-containing protein [Clostridium sp. Ade.TY]